MMRLKELHKEDKVKLQQGIMALYKKESKSCIRMFAHINSNSFLLCYLQDALYIFRNEASAIFGWIKDLSAQDPTSIFNLFGLIHGIPLRSF